MIVDWLIRRAKRTPYYHLAGYMNRWWLVPYNVVITRDLGPAGVPHFLHTDGTGPVSWRRPIARLFQLCGIAIRVHEILRSDGGRHPHDHPWPYLTIVLRGGYYETRYDECGEFVFMSWYGPGSVLWRPANSWHRLDVPAGQTATTLFITGRKAAESWGFNVDGVKVPYYEYDKS